MKTLRLAASLAFLLTACGEDELPSFTTSTKTMGTSHGDASASPTPSSDVPPPELTFLRELAPAGMLNPTRVCAGADGTLVVTDATAQQVTIFDDRHRVKRQISASRPLGCALDELGNIYVGNDATGNVDIYDDQGASLGTLTDRDHTFVQPSSLAWLAPSTLFVVEARRHQVHAYQVDGSHIFSAGEFGYGPGQFSFPGEVAVNPAGGMFAVDVTGAHVHAYTHDGLWLYDFGTYGHLPGQFTRPQGLAIDELGRLYVSDAFQGHVQVVDAAGAHLAYVGEYGVGFGQMKTPTGVAIDPCRRLYVTSYETGKVLVWGIDDFCDPAGAIEARAWLTPNHVPARTKRKWIGLRLELPDTDPAQIDVDTITLAHVPAKTFPLSVGDDDQNGVLELGVKIPFAPLAAALHPNQHTLEMHGALLSGAVFEGSVTLTTTP